MLVNKTSKQFSC